MKNRWRLQQWIAILGLSLLTLITLLLLVVGIPRIGELTAVLVPDRSAENGSVPTEVSTPVPSGEGAEAGHAPCLLSLDPHNALHGFVVLPLLAGLALLGSAAVVRTIARRWPGTARQGAELSEKQAGKGARARYVLLGLSFWIALSVFLILDLAGSISLYPGFVAIYALCWVLVGLLFLYARPMREKIVILTLFLVVLFSVRFVDWNTRKPFLRALDRVTAGITEAQADEIMDGYMKGISPMAQMDEQGGIDWGTVNYRHTTEAWGNVDVGVLAFQNGRVVRVDYLPD